MSFNNDLLNAIPEDVLLSFAYLYYYNIFLDLDNDYKNIPSVSKLINKNEYLDKLTEIDAFLVDNDLLFSDFLSSMMDAIKATGFLDEKKYLSFCKKNR